MGAGETAGTLTTFQVNSASAGTSGGESQSSMRQGVGRARGSVRDANILTPHLVAPWAALI